MDTRDDVLACLESLQGEPDIEIAVLDNVSGDGTADAIRERYPDVRVIEAERRAGFGANNNVLIRATTAPYVYLLNPDTVSQPGSVAALARRPRRRPRRGGRRPARRVRRRPRAGHRLAVPVAADVRAVGADARARRHHAVRRRGAAAGGVGDGLRAAAAAQRAGRGRPVRRGLLHVQRGDRPRATARPRRPRGAVDARDDRRAPPGDLDRGRPRAPGERGVARPAPLLGEAPLADRAADRGGRARRPVRAARGHRRRAAAAAGAAAAGAGGAVRSRHVAAGRAERVAGVRGPGLEELAAEFNSRREAAGPDGSAA